jgi:hypothetical protein
MRDPNWLCLDCSKDTFDEYYGVRNHLWRRAVDRSKTQMPRGRLFDSG